MENAIGTHSQVSHCASQIQTLLPCLFAADYLVPLKVTGEKSYSPPDTAPFDYTLPPEEGQALRDESEGLTFDYD